MSLKLWLPLRGTLENLGLTETGITQANLTVSNNGKIGDCYSFNGSNSYILVNNGLTLDDKEWSYCCWARQDADYGTGSNCLYSQRTSSSNSQRAIFMYPDKRIYIDEKTRYSTTLDTSADLTQWCHYVILRRASNIEVHINGELVLSYEWTNYPTSLGTKCSFGSSQADSETSISGNNLKGEMNDIRLYNHALSIKEIKELAKGLCIHYTLDGGFGAIPNQITNSGPFTTTGYNIAGSSNGWGAATLVDCDISPTGKAIRSTYTGTGGHSGGIHHQPYSYSSLENGVNYTFSVWVRASKEVPMNIYNEMMSTKTPSMPITIGTNWTHVAVTGPINTSASYHSDIVYCNGTNVTTDMWIEIFGMKLEKGSKATPWIPHNTDELYSILSINNDKEIDISGYCNHGTKSSDLTFNSDTARYSVSTVFDNNADTITVNPCFSVSQVMSEISVAIWFKTSTLNSTNPNWFSLGENSFFRARIVTATSVWCYYRLSSASAAIGQKSYTFTSKTLTDNVWHQVVCTFKDGVSKCYIDGSIIGTLDESATGKYLMCSSAGSTWHLAGYRANSENFIGSLSDFRIYSTALSADDIAELYRASAQIDNGGNIYCSDFVED